MELGEPDASGRRRPVPIPGSRVRDARATWSSWRIGTRANPLLTDATPDLELNKWGNIVADDDQA